jgi:serine protease Do
MPRTALAVAALIVAVAFGAIGFLVGTRRAETRHPVAPPQERPFSAPSFADIVQRVNHSVVQVSVPHGRRLPPSVESGEEGDTVRDEGSGFVIDDQGHILTNQHLVAGADRIKVRLADKRELVATLVGSDESTDVAVIHVDSADLTPIPLGDSDELRVGDWVCAIGNPYSFEHTVTAGVVSSKGRKIFDDAFDDYIQTDAAINPGNSGGPLLNLQGEAVGMNAAVSLEGEGIGFAVPINVAREILAQILRNGRVSRGDLGIRVRDLEPDLRDLVKAPADSGSLVVEVLPGSAGEKAGLRRYDVITVVSGQAIERSDDFTRAVSALAPGTEVAVAYLRDGTAATAKAVITDRPRDTPLGASSPSPLPPRPGPVDVLGLVIVDARPPKKGAPPVPPGVVIREIESSSAGADLLERGDVIVDVNRQPTPDAAAYKRIIGAFDADSVAWLLVRRPSTGDVFLTRLDSEMPEEAPQAAAESRK